MLEKIKLDDAALDAVAGGMTNPATTINDTTAADLLTIQHELATSSQRTAVHSTIVKERGDTLKGVVQKF